MLDGHLEMNKTLIATLFAFGIIAQAFASPPGHDELGFSHQVLSTNPITVEISLKPKRHFDGVTLEAGSGVAAITPACSFSAVTEGGSYSCRFEVTGRPTDPAMTVNIVGSYLATSKAPALVEIHHLTFKNPTFVRSTPPPSSKHVLQSSAAH
jgi:hypothetical protein